MTQKTLKENIKLILKKVKKLGKYNDDQWDREAENAILQVFIEYINEKEPSDESHDDGTYFTYNRGYSNGYAIGTQEYKSRLLEGLGKENL